MENMRGRRGAVQRPYSRRVIYEDFQPTSNWIRQSDKDILRVDLPGFKKEETKVEWDESSRVISVSGLRRLGENRYSRFKQGFSVPDDSDVYKRSSTLENSILFVYIPKKAKEIVEQPKQVGVEGEKKQETYVTQEKPKKDDNEIKEKPKEDLQTAEKIDEEKKQEKSDAEGKPKKDDNERKEEPKEHQLQMKERPKEKHEIEEEKKEETSNTEKKKPKKQETSNVEEKPKKQETSNVEEKIPKKQEISNVEEKQETSNVEEKKPKKQETSGVEEKPKKQETSNVEEKPKKDGNDNDDKHECDQDNEKKEGRERNEVKRGFNEDRQEREEKDESWFVFEERAMRVICKNKGVVLAAVVGLLVGFYLSRLSR